MSNIWERFDDIADATEVMEAKSQFTPVEEGTYEVLLEELVAGESQKGLPMLKGKFRIKDSNRIIFYNQMLQNLNYPNMTAVNIAEAVSFIGGILEDEVEFEGLSALAELIGQIPSGTTHYVEVSYGPKDFEKKYTKLKIVDKPTELEDIPGNEIDNDDIPF